MSDKDKTCRERSWEEAGKPPVNAFLSSARTRRACNPGGLRLGGSGEPEMRLELAFNTWRFGSWLLKKLGRFPHNPTDTSSIPCNSGNENRVCTKALKLKEEDKEILLL